jgi:hypothetical protein
MSWRRTLILLALPILGGCNDTGLKVPRVEGVTEIRVFGINPKLPAKIRDPDRVARVMTFINDRHNHWHIPEPGAPAPEVVAVIYDGDKQKYVFAAGPSYFENGPYYMLSRRASRDEYREFLLAIGVNEFHASSEETVHRP